MTIKRRLTRPVTLDDVAAIAARYYAGRSTTKVPHDTSTTAEAVLWWCYVWAGPHPPITALSKTLGLSVHAASRAARQLVRLGLAEYMPCPGDTRQKCIKLTPAGRQRVRADAHARAQQYHTQGLVKIVTTPP